MEKYYLKRPLREESNSSSDEECGVSPTKQPHIRVQSPECVVLDSSPKEASTATTGFRRELQEIDSKQVPVSETESHGLAILSAEASKLEYIKGHDPQCTKDILVGKESSGAIDLPQKKKSPATPVPTTEIQDNPLGRDVISQTEEDSPEDAFAKALKIKFMKKYASEYSKELLFATDVMTLVRHLNKLPCQWIVYATSGNQPKSPCNDTLDEALEILWTKIKDELGRVFLIKMKANGINYKLLQKMILNLAEKAGKKVFEAKTFLFYCISFAQLAVHAELNGVPDAPEFVPLVICHTIQRLKDSGKLPENFWERIAEKALDIVGGVKKL